MGVEFVLNKLQYILDIGSSSLRLLAVAKFAGRARIVAEESILYDGYLDGEFLSSDDLDENLSMLISKMTDKMRKPIRHVIVGVPSEFCICVCKRISRKYVGLHKVTEADLKALYENNIDGDSTEYTTINYSPMQFVLDDDFKTLTPVGKKTSSLILDASFILAKKSFIGLLTEKFHSLGVSDLDFVSSALGQAMQCERVRDDIRPIAIVDVGHISTSVCVYKGEGLALLSSFSMGGGHISSDIMQVLGLSFKEAELIKRKAILTVESSKNEYYEICTRGSLIKAPINITNQVVKSRIEMIAKVISDILSIDDVFSGIDIYLTGDGIANFKGVKNILKDITGLNVYEYKNPFDNSKDKFQTSKTGLVSLCEIMI
ncbi:MAG: hypothetical protein E7351_01840 [Clostridiales bacterium]|nr:hypothetical protein [Clostridiales bacterium]